MTTLRTLRKLILGETLVLPCGIAATLAAALLVREVAGEHWHRLGGFVLLGGVLVVLVVGVIRSAGPR